MELRAAIDLALRLLAIACVPDAEFVSPQGSTAGIGALNTSIAEFRRAFPAAGVVSFGRSEKHGGRARVAWATRWNTGQPDHAGEDFAELATICVSGCSSHSTEPRRPAVTCAAKVPLK